METKIGRRKLNSISIIGLSSNSLLLSEFIISHPGLTKSNKNNTNFNIKYNFKLNLHYTNQKTYCINSGKDKITQSI
jgi:hypothetical protein